MTKTGLTRSFGQRHLGRSGGVYRCSMCQRMTRQTTDSGDEASVQMCRRCHDRSGEENRLSDHDLDVAAGLAEWDRLHPAFVTKAQALAEAKRRWGKMARVVDRGKGWNQAGVGRFNVGYVDATIIPMYMIEGDGPTWDEAFQTADRHAAFKRGA